MDNKDKEIEELKEKIYQLEQNLGQCEKGYSLELHTARCEIRRLEEKVTEYEDKIEKGVLVELPKDKWCITTGHNADETLNYLVEHQNPIAKFWGGKWHIGMEEIKWRPILEKYDTKAEANQRLKELQGENNNEQRKD